MNTNTDPGWNEVGDRLGSLGLKLKYHAEQAAGAAGATVNDGAEGTTVNDALDNIREAIEEAFAALRGVVTDPAIRDDVMSVANGVAQAISSTLREGLKHPGSIVKRASTKKATTKSKAVVTTTSGTKKTAPTKKAATAKAAPAKKAAPTKKGVKR